MKIYGISEGDFDDWHIVEYFEDKAMAELYRDTMNANPEEYMVHLNEDITGIELRTKDFKLTPCEYIETTVHMVTKVPSEAYVTEYVSTVFEHMYYADYEITVTCQNAPEAYRKEYNGVYISAQGTNVAKVRELVQQYKTYAIEHFDENMQEAANEPTKDKRLKYLRVTYNKENV